MARIAESGILSTSFLVFLCFDIKNQTASPDCSLLGLGERRGRREGTGEGEEEGSDEPSALEGSLAAGGGDSGRGPAVGLPGWPLGCCFPQLPEPRSQVIVLVEAWADSELGESRKSEAVSTCPHPSPTLVPERHTHCSGDSSTVAMNGRVDFRRRSYAKCPGSALET